MVRIFALSTLGVYWIALFIGTHIPSPGTMVEIHDKWLHFGAYAGLAFLLAAGLATMRLRYGTLMLPLSVAAVYGLFDEWSQMAVPGREADVADWAADVFGAGVGVIAFSIASLIAARWMARGRAFPRKPVPETAA